MRILLTTFGSRGDLEPYVAIARGLAARGHVPAVATHEYWRAAVEAAGVEFRPLRPDAHPEDRRLFARAMHPRWGPRVVIREIVMPSLRDTWADTMEAARDVDAILTHPLSLAAPLVAAERDLPWVSSVLAPLSFFSRQDFPVLPQLPRAWRLYGVPGTVSFLSWLGSVGTRPWVRPLRALRGERGLIERAHPLLGGQHSPLLALALFSRVLAEPRSDWPASARVTGFAFLDAPGDRGPESERLAEFLDAGPAPIAFTLGSSAVHVAGRFYAESLAAARRAGRRAVLLVGDLPENVPGGLGDDAIAIARAPFRALFPRCAAIVHHGGIGTLGQALRAGRPMLVVPWSHDQPDNAHRAERLGIARVIRAGAYRGERAAAALGTLLDDPAVTDRAERIGALVRGEDGVTAACDEIERALATG